MPAGTRKTVTVDPVDVVDVEASPRRPSPAESTDPAVHQLLAHRQSAEMNNDEAAMAAVDAQLADLGYL